MYLPSSHVLNHSVYENRFHVPIHMHANVRLNMQIAIKYVVWFQAMDAYDQYSGMTAIAL